MWPFKTSAPAPKPVPWRCRLCKSKEDGLFCNRVGDSDTCGMCQSYERQWEADRRKRQEYLAASVAGGLKYSPYRGERSDSEVAAEAMRIAKAIMESQ